MLKRCRGLALEVTHRHEQLGVARGLVAGLEIQLMRFSVGGEAAARGSAKVHLRMRCCNQPIASRCHVVVTCRLHRVVVCRLVEGAVSVLEPASACTTNTIAARRRIGIGLLQESLQQPPLAVDVVQLEEGSVVTVFGVKQVGVAHAKALELLDRKVGRMPIRLLYGRWHEELGHLSSPDVQLPRGIVALGLRGPIRALLVLLEAAS